MESTGKQQALLQELQDVVLNLLPNGYPTLNEMSRRLGISSRTLQRRLAEAGLSYRGVIDQVRFRRACLGLSKGHVKVADLALELGYRDPSSFSRAFARWSGMAPGRYREGKRR